MLSIRWFCYILTIRCFCFSPVGKRATIMKIDGSLVKKKYPDFKIAYVTLVSILPDFENIYQQSLVWRTLFEMNTFLPQYWSPSWKKLISKAISWIIVITSSTQLYIWFYLDVKGKHLEAFLPNKQCPALSSLCDHTLWFLRLEL